MHILFGDLSNSKPLILNLGDWLKFRLVRYGPLCGGVILVVWLQVYSLNTIYPSTRLTEIEDSRRLKTLESYDDEVQAILVNVSI